LRPNEAATECFALVIDKKSSELNFGQSNVIKLPSIGDYHIDWRRKKKNKVQAKRNTEDGGDDDDDDDDDDDEEDENEPSESIVNPMTVQTKILLPEIAVEFFPFLVKADMPTFGCLNENLTITYIIHNRLQAQILDIECVLEENEFFSLSGKKMVNFDFFLKNNVYKTINI
jgi:hypothetical protein